LFATVVNVDVRLVPTAPNAVIAATAMRAAIRPYSIAVAPSSFVQSLINVGSIALLLSRRFAEAAYAILVALTIS
jgi:hypothetical protein